MSKKEWCVETRRLFKEVGLGECWETELVGGQGDWGLLVKRTVYQREVARWREELWLGVGVGVGVGPGPELGVGLGLGLALGLGLVLGLRVRGTRLVVREAAEGALCLLRVRLGVRVRVTVRARARAWVRAGVWGVEEALHRLRGTR